MRLVARLAAACGALGLLAIATPAFAVDADCVWNQLPAERRAQMVEDYRREGFAALGKIDIEESELTSLGPACGVTDDTAEDAGFLIVGVWVERASQVVLTERYGVAPGALPKAWQALTPSERSAVSVLSVDIVKGRNPDSAPLDQALPKVVQSLGIANVDGEVVGHVMAYMLGRGLMEALSD